MCLRGTARHHGSPSRPSEPCLTALCHRSPHISLSPSPAVFLHSSSFQTNSHPIVKASPPSAPRQLDSFLPDPRITPPFWKSRLSEDSLEKTICHSDTSLLPRCENSECFLDWFIPQSSFISFAQRPAGMNWVYVLCVHTMSSANQTTDV